MHEKDLALNDLQWWICHKTKPNLTRTYKRVFVCMLMCVHALGDTHRDSNSPDEPTPCKPPQYRRCF